MLKNLYPRLTRSSGQSFFLLGVRGVGKSAWACQQFSDARRIDLLDEARYHTGMLQELIEQTLWP